MADKNIEETVKRIAMERLDRKPEEVTLEAKFIEDLGADSLDIIEIVMALEEEFDIDIGDDANRIETVSDAVAYIENKMTS